MTAARKLVSSGSPLDPEIGFSRAVRSGPYVCVAGETPGIVCAVYESSRAGRPVTLGP